MGALSTDSAPFFYSPGENMFEELNSREALPVVSEDPEQQPVTSEAEPQEQERPASPPASEQPKGKAKKGPNLYELPQFREWQAVQDRQHREAQQRIQELEQRLEQNALAGMDDAERLRYQNEKLAAKLRQHEEQTKRLAEQQKANAQRMQDLQEISEAHNVPMAELINAETFRDALKLAAAYVKRQAMQTTEQKEQRRERNAVDLGGGKPSVPEDRRTQALREAMESRDAKAYVRLLLSPNGDEE